MRIHINIIIVLLLFMPGAGWAADPSADAGGDTQIAFAPKNPLITLRDRNKKANAEHKQSDAKVKMAARNLNSFLNGKNVSSSSKKASLYSSPGETLRINPFFKRGMKGLALEVWW